MSIQFTPFISPENPWYGQKKGQRDSVFAEEHRQIF
jgi:hypothetical protein